MAITKRMTPYVPIEVLDGTNIRPRKDIDTRNDYEINLEKNTKNAREYIQKIEKFMDEKDLTFEQYKHFRESKQGLEKVQATLNTHLTNGYLTEEEVSKINKKLTGFLRNQHYKLLIEKGKISIPEKIENDSIEERVVNKGTLNDKLYDENWKEYDDKMYRLERILSGMDEKDKNIGSIEEEKELIESIALNRDDPYQRKTLELLHGKSRFRLYLGKLLSFGKKSKN